MYTTKGLLFCFTFYLNQTSSGIIYYIERLCPHVKWYIYIYVFVDVYICIYISRWSRGFIQWPFCDSVLFSSPFLVLCSVYLYIQVNVVDVVSFHSGEFPWKPSSYIKAIYTHNMCVLIRFFTIAQTTKCCHYNKCTNAHIQY